MLLTITRFATADVSLSHSTTLLSGRLLHGKLVFNYCTSRPSPCLLHFPPYVFPWLSPCSNPISVSTLFWAHRPLCLCSISPCPPIQSIYPSSTRLLNHDLFGSNNIRNDILIRKSSYAGLKVVHLFTLSTTPVPLLKGVELHRVSVSDLPRSTGRRPPLPRGVLYPRRFFVRVTTDDGSPVP